MKNEKLYLLIPRIMRDSTTSELKVEVKVIGNRTVFGRKEVEVTPVSGSGAWWVLEENLAKTLKVKQY